MPEPTETQLDIYSQPETFADNGENEKTALIKRLIGGIGVQESGIVSFTDSLIDIDIELVEAREELLRNYESFKPLVEELKKRLETHEDTRTDEAYLGAGSNSRAFTLIRDGKEYVVIVPSRGRRAWQPDLNTDYRVKQLLPAKDISHLEQISALSYEDGVTISERIPGSELAREMPLDLINNVSQEQVDSLVDTVIAGVERGISFDPKPSNIIYDAEQGFGIIDFHTAHNNSGGLGDELAGIIQGLSNVAQGKWTPTAVEDFPYKLEGAKIRLAILQKMRIAVSRKLDGDDLNTVLDKVDGLLESSEQYIKDFSDEQYVIDVVAKNLQDIEERRQRTAARKGKSGWESIS